MWVVLCYKQRNTGPGYLVTDGHGDRTTQLRTKKGGSYKKKNAAIPPQGEEQTGGAGPGGLGSGGCQGSATSRNMRERAPNPHTKGRRMIRKRPAVVLGLAVVVDLDLFYFPRYAMPQSESRQPRPIPPAPTPPSPAQLLPPAPIPPPLPEPFPPTPPPSPQSVPS